MLTMAADPIGKTVALMVECLTPLAHWDTCHQLVLNSKDQYLGRLAIEKKQKCMLTKIFHPRHVAPVPTHNPLSRVCSMSSARRTLGMICRGEGSSVSETLTSDLPSLGARGRERVRGGTTTSCSTIPPEAIHTPVTWRACARSPM